MMSNMKQKFQFNTAIILNFLSSFPQNSCWKYTDLHHQAGELTMLSTFASS